MHAKFLQLVLENGEQVSFATALTGDNLYVKSANGTMLRVLSARVQAGIKAQGTMCINPDGTMVEYDQDGQVQRIIPASETWLKSGDRI